MRPRLESSSCFLKIGIQFPLAGALDSQDATQVATSLLVRARASAPARPVRRQGLLRPCRVPAASIHSSATFIHSIEAPPNF